MSDTPQTDALIAHLDKEPESRLTFVIKKIVTHAMQLERDLTDAVDIGLALSGYLDPDHPDDFVRGQEAKLRALRPSEKPTPPKNPGLAPQPRSD